ncbi:hypothetical protein K469DRAFT_702329 [Zopfia rhizophila CBS 207.26]|uniref:Uncharacterized protein n=1 Tax=Zopfia rhizophila CBS 207.26 TaxID=1314779 RepID=A0A6A6D7B8_9PEZI|nr:hypothetical protein K469DRAFT_702329 [Zopfia rhizophila CBS 207.26]
MYKPILAISLFLSAASAFETKLYTSKQCTGTTSTFSKKVSDGCQTERAGSFQGIINSWTSEEDNNQLLVTYSDKTCCHANMMEMIDWKVGCQEAKSGVQSWRIVSQDDWDKGKAGDDYTCGGT